jgi:2-iminoacetate synthase
MEFSVPGFIKRYCTPNAILTLSEYLIDYAPETTAKRGWEVININIEKLDDDILKTTIREKINQLKAGKRDLYF